ncbi:MAG: tryptophan synthase subunit beta like protein [Gammaproteobacteria bacterium]|jgi:hypothetical protein|nr:tryptophan synthase subunit beta like protein [Gammaproteobacteria bacterium]
MPFVKRNGQGAITAVSETSEAGFGEELAANSLELADFLGGVSGSDSDLGATDLEFVRVLEDVVQLLIDKGVILFTDLPDSAQRKIMLRQQLRSKFSGKLDLIGDD